MFLLLSMGIAIHNEMSDCCFYFVILLVTARCVREIEKGGRQGEGKFLEGWRSQAVQVLRSRVSKVELLYNALSQHSTSRNSSIADPMSILSTSAKALHRKIDV